MYIYNLFHYKHSMFYPILGTLHSIYNYKHDMDLTTKKKILRRESYRSPRLHLNIVATCHMKRWKKLQKHMKQSSRSVLLFCHIIIFITIIIIIITNMNMNKNVWEPLWWNLTTKTMERVQLCNVQIQTPSEF